MLVMFKSNNIVNPKCDGLYQTERILCPEMSPVSSFCTWLPMTLLTRDVALGIYHLYHYRIRPPSIEFPNVLTRPAWIERWRSYEDTEQQSQCRHGKMIRHSKRTTCMLILRTAITRFSTWEKLAAIDGIAVSI